jgi:hypothetical protein
MKLYGFLIIVMNIRFLLAFFPTNLESILTRKAILSTIFNNIRYEMSERIFEEVVNIPYYVPTHHHENEYLFVSLFATYLYGQWKYNMGAREEYAKFKKIDKYNSIYNYYKKVIIIILFMFFKDVKNVL